MMLSFLPGAYDKPSFVVLQLANWLGLIEYSDGGELGIDVEVGSRLMCRANGSLLYVSVLNVQMHRAMELLVFLHYARESSRI